MREDERKGDEFGDFGDDHDEDADDSGVRDFWALIVIASHGDFNLICTVDYFASLAKTQW